MYIVYVRLTFKSGEESNVLSLPPHREVLSVEDEREVNDPHHSWGNTVDKGLINQSSARKGLNQLTFPHKGVNLPDGHNVSQHVTEPLRVHEVEVCQERVLVVKEGSVVMEEPDGLLQFSVGRVATDESPTVSKYQLSVVRQIEIVEHSPLLQY